MINTIIDLSHLHTIDFATVKAAGIVAVIHKATEGATFVDDKYLQRRKQAKDAGLLWGAYHFSSAADVAAQVRNFLDHTIPGDDDLIALDWEPSSVGLDMTQDQARQFVQLIHDATGRWPVIYGGSLLRESVGNRPDPVLANCPLWYAQYAAVPEPTGIPTQIWPDYTLWQYTDGVNGNPPHQTPGTSGADRSIFRGSTEDLRRVWPVTRRVAAAAMA